MYHQEARTYIDKLIRIRRRLISEGRSRSLAAVTSVGVIENYLANYSCNNNQHMSRFITSYYNHLLTIIPGSDSRGSGKLKKELDAFRDKANEILNTKSDMNYQISQGVPKHGFFALAQPHNGINGRISLDPDKPKCEIECRHPRTGDITKAELIELLTFPLVDIPDGLSLLTYGVKAEKLIDLLLARYPEFKTNPQVEFLLLKRK